MSLGNILSPKLRRDFRAASARRAAAAALSDVDTQQHQFISLQALWRDAVHDVPYYSALVDRGNAPRDILSWEDLQAVPILSRQILQDRSAEFIRRSAPPTGYTRTAGSTGTPLRLGMNQDERDVMRIVKLAAWQDLGYVPSSRLFLIWGHAHLLGTGWTGRINHIKRKAADAFLGYRRVDAYRLNREACQAHAANLLAFRPLGIVGYASALDLFARYTSHLRDQFRGLGVRFVLATAEPAPRADSFAALEDLFGCPVVEEYGGAEFGQVAFKVGNAPFHVYDDLNYLESESSNIGGTHPALLTSLYRRYVPLFRYRVGDELVGVQTLPNGHVARFESVAGRINDVIALPGGDSIHSVSIFHCIHQEPAVHNIQMQLRDDGIEICLVARRDRDDLLESRIRKRLAQVHPLLGSARLTFAEDLQTSRAGKRRWFVDERSGGRNASRVEFGGVRD